MLKRCNFLVKKKYIRGLSFLLSLDFCQRKNVDIHCMFSAFCLRIFKGTTLLIVLLPNSKVPLMKIKNTIITFFTITMNHIEHFLCF